APHLAENIQLPGGVETGGIEAEICAAASAATTGTVAPAAAQLLHDAGAGMDVCGIRQSIDLRPARGTGNDLLLPRLAHPAGGGQEVRILRQGSVDQAFQFAIVERLPPI